MQAAHGQLQTKNHFSLSWQTSTSQARMYITYSVHMFSKQHSTRPTTSLISTSHLHPAAPVLSSKTTSSQPTHPVPSRPVPSPFPPSSLHSRPHISTPSTIPLPQHHPRPKKPTGRPHIRTQIDRGEALATSTAGGQTHAPRHGTVEEGGAIAQIGAKGRDVAEAGAVLVRLAEAGLRAGAAGRVGADCCVVAVALRAAEAVLAFGRAGALWEKQGGRFGLVVGVFCGGFFPFFLFHAQE